MADNFDFLVFGWRRDDVFITNVVKCRPPDNRDPQPDEIAACEPYLRRQLEILDPAVVVTLGRHSMGRFMPAARIGQAHGTARPADPETGAADATVYAMYHPAAALRSLEVERQSREDVRGIPTALVEARKRRERANAVATTTAPAPASAPAAEAPASPPSEQTPANIRGATVTESHTDIASIVASTTDDPGVADDQMHFF